MPYFENDIFQYFKKEIEDAANEKIKALEDEIETTKQKNLERIEQDVRDNVDRVIDTELNEINVEFSATMNRIKTQAHQEVIKKKQELLDSIISEVKTKCLEFVKSSQYKKTMSEMIRKIDKEFCGDEFLFKIKQTDKVLETIIKEQYSRTYKIEKVDTIEIGGFIGVCTKKGILTDQTIDSTLEEAKIRFYENSKLAVKQ
ncbi:MAG: V-type ATP synthase subunit E [Bacilli bacterium]|nr:V-type ATP synthase subunit E [Bacilli bacterium]